MTTDRRILHRLAIDGRGQALSEYGIVLALMAGLHSVEQAVERLADDPQLLWKAGIVLAIAIFVFARRR